VVGDLLGHLQGLGEVVVVYMAFVGVLQQILERERERAREVNARVSKCVRAALPWISCTRAGRTLRRRM
jgi:hypothetical protein